MITKQAIIEWQENAPWIDMWRGEGILRTGIEYVPIQAFDIVKSTFFDRI